MNTEVPPDLCSPRSNQRTLSLPRQSDLVPSERSATQSTTASPGVDVLFKSIISLTEFATPWTPAI